MEIEIARRPRDSVGGQCVSPNDQEFNAQVGKGAQYVSMILVQQWVFL
jgi:hypothetical protein